MTLNPKSFDPETSREVIGDERARAIEAKARADADKGVEAFAPPPYTETRTYWGGCREEFARRVYLAQFTKRLQRNERKSTSLGRIE